MHIAIRRFSGHTTLRRHDRHLQISVSRETHLPPTKRKGRACAAHPNSPPACSNLRIKHPPVDVQCVTRQLTTREEQADLARRTLRSVRRVDQIAPNGQPKV